MFSIPTYEWRVEPIGARQLEDLFRLPGPHMRDLQPGGSGGQLAGVGEFLAWLLLLGLAAALVWAVICSVNQRKAGASGVKVFRTVFVLGASVLAVASLLLPWFVGNILGLANISQNVFSRFGYLWVLLFLSVVLIGFTSVLSAFPHWFWRRRKFSKKDYFWLGISTSGTGVFFVAAVVLTLVAMKEQGFGIIVVGIGSKVAIVSGLCVVAAGIVCAKVEALAGDVRRASVKTGPVSAEIKAVEQLRQAEQLIRFRHSCGASIAVGVAHAGLKARCKHCGGLLTIPPAPSGVTGSSGATGLEVIGVSTSPGVSVNSAVEGSVREALSAVGGGLSSDSKRESSVPQKPTIPAGKQSSGEGVSNRGTTTGRPAASGNELDGKIQALKASVADRAQRKGQLLIELGQLLYQSNAKIPPGSAYAQKIGLIKAEEQAMKEMVEQIHGLKRLRSAPPVQGKSSEVTE